MNDLEWMETYMKDTQTDYIDCWCKDFDHVMRFNMMLDGDKEHPSVLFWLEGNLIDNASFWKRLKYAWKYLWRRSQDNVAFSSTEFSLKQVKQLRGLCYQYQDIYKMLKVETCEPLRKNSGEDYKYPIDSYQ